MATQVGDLRVVARNDHQPDPEERDPKACKDSNCRPDRPAAWRGSESRWSAADSLRSL